MTSTDVLFLQTSRNYLTAVYLPRIEAALRVASDADVWWRPHKGVPSVGHLLLHLAGNVRQWVISGLGGERDVRTRAREFEPTEQPPKDELFARLRATVLEAGEVLRRLEGSDLTARCRIQGFDDTRVAAIYHVVEHFSWHTGQIVSIAKQRAGAAHGIAFYDDAKINELRNE
ncbi:MAG: DinB family protein [Planctomycetota bacterium]